MNGVSKKLCVAAVSIGALVSMSDGAENKLPYAIAVTAICIVYKIIQGWIDWKK